MSATPPHVLSGKALGHSFWKRLLRACDGSPFSSAITSWSWISRKVSVGPMGMSRVSCPGSMRMRSEAISSPSPTTVAPSPGTMATACRPEAMLLRTKGETA
jgi:hypothetical protein